MPATHTLYVATFTRHTVSIPDRCPGCGADFHEDGALDEENHLLSCNVPSHLDAKGVLTAEGGTDYSDSYRPISIDCRRCGRSITPQEPHVLTLLFSALQDMVASQQRRSRGEPFDLPWGTARAALDFARKRMPEDLLEALTAAPAERSTKRSPPRRRKSGIGRRKG